MVDNRFNHKHSRQNSGADLAAGEHHISVVYVQVDGDSDVKVEYRSPGNPNKMQRWELLGGSATCHDTEDDLVDVDVSGLQSGWMFESFEIDPSAGSGNSLEEIRNSMLKEDTRKVGTTDSISVFKGNRQPWPSPPYNTPHELFHVRYWGLLRIQQPGTYEFILGSDDGSLLFIDGVRLIDNDRKQAHKVKTGQTVLSAGLHAIEVQYFEWKIDASLEVLMRFVTPTMDPAAVLPRLLDGHHVFHSSNRRARLFLHSPRQRARAQVGRLVWIGGISPSNVFCERVFPHDR